MEAKNKEPMLGLKKELSLKGLKTTAKRLEILQLLQGAKRPLTVEEIHRQATKATSVDLATIYRNLKQLVDTGFVKKSFFEQGKIQYSLAEDQKHSHDHHIQCTRCEKIQSVQVCLPLAHTKVFADLGYQEVSHRLEFFGICQSCKAPQSKNKKRISS